MPVVRGVPAAPGACPIAAIAAIMANVEDRTSVQVYTSDAAWLRQKQRELSFARSEHVPMFDLVHELIEAIRTQGEGA